jgi:hypothetical protein
MVACACSSTHPDHLEPRIDALKEPICFKALADGSIKENVVKFVRIIKPVMIRFRASDVGKRCVHVKPLPESRVTQPWTVIFVVEGSNSSKGL